jgi:UV DNA damage endonuclease
MLFLRITSDLVPFALHPACTFPWQEHFSDAFRELGEYIRNHRFRISMHPDQFVLINTPNPAVLVRSIDELRYHAAILDLLGLDRSAKIQVHVGGVYGDKEAGMERFIRVYDRLDETIRQRLVIENDERLYSAADCLHLHQRTGIPVLFDSFHHAIFNNGESVPEMIRTISGTWKSGDGAPMIDYSSQQPGKRTGAHAEHIDEEDFLPVLVMIRPFDPDVMLEIKDKEKSAAVALGLAKGDPRLVTG